MSDPAHHPGVRWFVTTCVLLAAVGVRVAPMTQSLWYDEAYRTRLVIGGPGAGDLLRHDVHNPLYNAFMWGWVRVFGDAEWVIRSPSLLAGIGVVLIVWRWAGARWGRGVADFAAAFLLLAPVHVWYSCEAKSSMFVVFFSLIAVLGVARVMERPTRVGVLWAGVAGALSVWTDWQTLLVLGPAWAGACVLSLRGDATGTPGGERERGARAAAVALAFSLTLILSLPLIVQKAQEVSALGRDYLGYFNPHRTLWMLAAWLPTGGRLFNAWRLDWFPVALALSPVYLPPLALGGRRLWTSREGRLVLVSVVAPMVLMWAGSELLVALHTPHRMYQPRNLIVMLPFYAVMLAAGVLAIRRRGLRLASATGAVGLALAGSVLSGTICGGEVPHPDWRAAGARLTAVSAGGAGRVGVASRTPLLALRYYAPSLEMVELPALGDAGEGVRRLMRERAWDEAWLISDPYWNPVADREIARLSEGFSIREECVQSLRLYRFRPRN